MDGGGRRKVSGRAGAPTSFVTRGTSPSPGDPRCPTGFLGRIYSKAILRVPRGRGPPWPGGETDPGPLLAALGRAVAPRPALPRPPGRPLGACYTLDDSSPDTPLLERRPTYFPAGAGSPCPRGLSPVPARVIVPFRGGGAPLPIAGVQLGPWSVARPAVNNGRAPLPTRSKANVPLRGLRPSAEVLAALGTAARRNVPLTTEGVPATSQWRPATYY